jgi:hypothetical protein
VGIAFLAIDGRVRFPGGEDFVLDRTEAFAAGIEQATKIARATLAVAAGASIGVATGAGCHRGPAETVQCGFADFAGVGEVDRIGRNEVVSDFAIAETALAVAATLAVGTALAVATFAVVIGAAHVAVAQGSPIVPVTAGIANLADVLPIYIAVFEALRADPTARFATVDGAALVGGTAIAVTTFAVALVAARCPIPMVRPVVRILSVEASLAVVVGIIFSVRDRLAIDDAGARPADTRGAAATSLSAQSAVFRRGPCVEGEIGIADFAIVGRVGVAGIDVLPVDVAMRSAFLAGDAVATFGGGATFPIATDPAGYTTAGGLVDDGRPG